MKYKLSVLIVFFFSTLALVCSPVYARETCSGDTDCLDSINDNTWTVRNSLTDLSSYLTVDSENPVILMTQDSFQTQVDDFNSNMTQLLQVFGIGFGLMLFATAFNLALFLYKR
jgi:hypothetical protein